MDWVSLTAEDLRFLVNAVYAAEQFQATIPVGLKLKLLQHMLVVQQQERTGTCELELSTLSADVVNRLL